MEWCLNCHRNPAVNLRPTTEIYNMAWAGPTSDRPVTCVETGKGGPTAQGISCTQAKPGLMQVSATVGANAQTFTSQDELGKYLTAKYHIRTANELASCEVCHR